MRRIWIVVGLIVSAVAGAATYKRASNWKEFHYFGTGAMANLVHPDAVIRTASLSQLPHDLLKVPIARDVLTEDLVFYYEQHEDRLGLGGAIKRIAYEHHLDWSDQLLAKLLDQPAEVALWRDGKGALRHYVVAVKRNALSRVLQEAATVALKDQQLTLAGEIETGSGKAQVLALEVNPRRKFLLVSQSDTLLIFSDPGLLFARDGKLAPEARKVVAGWLGKEGGLTHDFSLDAGKPAPKHTLAVNAATLALGYGDFLSGFRALRFDYGNSWSTAIRIDSRANPDAKLGDAALWNAAPVNPAACVVLPIDWSLAQKVVREANNKPALPDADVLAAVEGSGMVCWYNESNLYSPVFITRLSKLPQRNATLQSLAKWAMGIKTPDAKASGKAGGKSMVWRNPSSKATLAARGDYVVFSPDAQLVEKTLDTLGRTNPSVADQLPATHATLATITPRSLASMAEREIRRVTSDQNLLQAVNRHLPSRMKALASYPPYRLELAGQNKAIGEWLPVEWHTVDKAR